MVTKLGQFTKLGHLGFLNCPHFVTIFCQVLKMEIFFFDIPSNPPPIVVRILLTNQFFQKNLRFCILKKNAKLKRREGSFQLFKLFKLCNHFWSSFENRNNYFLIFLAIPRLLRSGIHWSRNFSKEIDVSLYFQQQQKIRTSLYRDIHPGNSWPYRFPHVKQHHRVAELIYK